MSDKLEIRVPYLKESYREYRYIVKFAENNPSEKLRAEIEVCKQMVELLPLQIDALQRGININGQARRSM